MDGVKKMKKKDEEDKMPPPLSRITLMGYGIGHLLNDLCSALWFTYSLVFYEQVIGFSSTLAGTVMLIGQVADAVATPAIGIWSDRSSLCGINFLGKRKSWYALGTLFVLVSMPFIYSPCIGCENKSPYFKLAYYAVFVVIFQFGWAAVQTVHLALVTDLTNISYERTALLSLRNTFTVVSNLAVYIVFVVILLRSPSSDPKFNSGDADLFMIMTASVLAIGGITSLLFSFIVREETSEPLLSQEEVEHENDEPERQVEASPSQPNSLGSWFKKWLLYHVAIIYMVTRIYCNVLQTFITLYVNNSLHLVRYNLALIPLVTYISGFVFSFLTNFLSRFCGKKVTYFLGMVLGVSACVWMELDTSEYYKQYYIYIVAVLLGAGSSIMLVVGLAVTSDLIGPDTKNSAFVYGLMSFVDKLSCGIVIWCLEHFVPVINQRYYIHALALTCGISCVIGAIMVLLLPSSLVREQIYDGRDRNSSPTNPTLSDPHDA